MSVQLSEKELLSPLMKYYNMSIDPVPAEMQREILTAPLKETGGLEPTDLNELFKPGYLEGEFGCYKLASGGIMVANLTPMPGVEPEMFDWWFAWHGLESMRYKIWDKDDHYYCQTRNPEISSDTSRSYKQRYINTVHDVKEALLDGEEPQDIVIEFVDPKVLGFDEEKLANFEGTIISTPGPMMMVHFLRKTEDGCELRTRFWMGYSAVDKKAVRVEGFPIEPMMAKALLVHNIKEFRHLAAILPKLYKEYSES